MRDEARANKHKKSSFNGKEPIRIASGKFKHKKWRMIRMEQPTRPDLKGNIQVKFETPDKKVFHNVGEIALWNHENTRFVLRGYVTIRGEKYLVSLEKSEK